MTISRRTILCGVAVAAKAAPKLEAVPGDGEVSVTSNGRVVTRFVHHAKWDKPFLYPLTTPSGRVLSRGFPVEPRPGESNDHKWHRGLWFGHGTINGRDFWREVSVEKAGRMVLDGKPRVLSGATAKVGARFALQPPMGEPPLGSVDQEYAVSLDGPRTVVRATFAVHADRGVALNFGDSDDGGFGFRLSDDFRQDRGALLRNSDLLQTTERIWGKAARWVQYAIRADGGAGVAAFDHPSNLRHPSQWHARPYSLCAANPFAAGSFAKDKTIDGSYTLPAGETLRLRYLALLYDGAMEPAEIETTFRHFAET
ncbi:MAG: PmoA family protein [Bryobacteraceae bacterium]|nr:PmoA family protein [Bryobacteraceae bacterium]